MSEMEMIKKLRDSLGAGMMDCKKAITEANGDYELAVEILRKKGLSSAQKKNSRSASEFLIGYTASENSLAVLELNCETDFVARNDKFQNLLQLGLTSILSIKSDNIDEIKNYNIGKGTFQEEVMSTIGIIGENITLGRVNYIDFSGKVAAFYLHNAIESSIVKAGKIFCSAIASVNSNDAVVKGKLSDLLKQISMHIAATNPIALSSKDVSNDIVEKERAIYLEKAKMSGKPDEIAEKIAEGGVKKFFEDNVLLEQTFVIDNKTKVLDVIKAFEKENNVSVTLEQFIRL